MLILQSSRHEKSIDMNHAVKESPKEDIGEHLTEKSVGEKVLPTAEILFPVDACLPQNQQP